MFGKLCTLPFCSKKNTCVRRTFEILKSNLFSSVTKLLSATEFILSQYYDCDDIGLDTLECKLMFITGCLCRGMVCINIVCVQEKYVLLFQTNISAHLMWY